jgi:hypothetical protein
MASQALHFVSSEPEFAMNIFDLSRFALNGEDNAALKAACRRSSDSKGSTIGLLPNGMMDLSWPFMCVSIMFTKEAIQLLRSGTVNAKCNKRKNVMSVLHELHRACFIDFAR